MSSRRVLFVSRWYPNPPDVGARLRVWGLLRGLAERHEVSLLSFAEADQDPDPAPELRRLCTRVRTLPLRPYQPRRLRALAGALGSRPRSFVDRFSPEMSAAVRTEVDSGRYDVVIAGNVDLVDYAPHFGRLPAVLEELELGTYADALAGSARQRLRALPTWLKLGRYLAARLPRFSACTVTSEVERRLLARLVPDYGEVHVVENMVDVEGPAPAPARHGNRLVFTGTLAYRPNLDALSWFCADVLPHIRRRIPDVEVDVAGHPGHEPFMPPAGVRLLGRIADVRSLVASAAVSIAPIRLGGGTRMKILEAMALETPVVTTSKGAEGLQVIHGRHLLIGNGAETFASQVVRLLRDDGLRRRLAAAARRLVEERHDVRVVGRRFSDLIDRVVESGPRRG